MKFKNNKLRAALVGCLLGGFGCVNIAHATQVFINELHYDNAGADVGEGVEIAGLAGTDLTGWKLVFYNGSDGSMYKTENLSGILPGQAFGFGALSFMASGIQNGAPDGLALIDNADNLIQFLSYEGVLTAIDGIAAGMTSTDIGIAESGATPVGASIGLSGSGQSYEDFSWSVFSAASFGQINNDQLFVQSQSNRLSRAQVPEPAGLLLLASGVVLLINNKRKTV